MGRKKINWEERLRSQNLVREILKASKEIGVPDLDYNKLSYEEVGRIAFARGSCITGITEGPGTHLVRGPFGMHIAQYEVPEGEVYVSYDIEPIGGGATYVFSRKNDGKLKLNLKEIP